MRDFSPVVTYAELKIQLSVTVKLLQKQSYDFMIKVSARFAANELVIKSVEISARLKLQPGWNFSCNRFPNLHQISYYSKVYICKKLFIYCCTLKNLVNT